MDDDFGNTTGQSPFSETWDEEVWNAFWRNKGQPWRSQPPISDRRQRELSTCLVTSDPQHDRFPFHTIKLTRADVEWLIAESSNSSFSNGIAARGNVAFPDHASIKDLAGIDLRGTDLRNLDLSGLPLDGLILGLPWEQWLSASSEQRQAASANCEGLILRNAYIRHSCVIGVNFTAAELEGAHFDNSRLDCAVFERADLRRANLDNCSLTRTNLRTSQLNNATLNEAFFNDADLREADLRGVTATHTCFLRAQMKSTNFQDADLTRADLRYAQLDEAELQQARLDYTDLTGASLARANLHAVYGVHTNFSESIVHEADLSNATLQLASFRYAIGDMADFRRANLEKATIYRAQFRLADFTDADLREVNLSETHLDGSVFRQANLGSADVHDAIARGCVFSHATLTKAKLQKADLQDTNMTAAQMEHVDLKWAKLHGVNLSGAQIGGADLRMAYLDSSTNLEGIIPITDNNSCVMLADVRWENANLAVVPWNAVSVLGDEEVLDKTVAKDYSSAVRAYRQLAAELQQQGLNEQSGKFAYRANYVERKVFLARRSLASYALSVMLDLLAGYGYKWWRTALVYLSVISGFTLLYLVNEPAINSGRLVGWDAVRTALVLSVYSFHGRGFFPGTVGPNSPIALASALEALIGLLVEASLIAALTRRFFGR